MLFKAVAKYFPPGAIHSKPVGFGMGETWLNALVACVEDLDYVEEGKQEEKDKYCEIIINLHDEIARIPLSWLRN